MNNSAARIFIPFMALAVNISFQILVFRLFPKIGLLRSLFLGFICGFLAICVIGFDAKSIINIVIYILLGYCYFHFVNMGQTARRIRILTELKDIPEGLSLRQILERYNSEDIIERRLNRLIDHGQVTQRNGRYYIGNPLMLIIARFFVAIKRIIFGVIP